MKGKMDYQFKEKGTIMSKISENIYEVEDENKKIHRKHTSQLRGINKRSLKERVVGSEQILYWNNCFTVIYWNETLVS